MNLLSMVHLEDRLYSDVDAITQAKPWNSSIDYTEISRIIALKRSESIQYLKSALENLS